MIHTLKPAPAVCGCQHAKQTALGFAVGSSADQSTGTPDWHWILIAALAALVIFQLLDRPETKPQPRRRNP
jgi:uncharacterized membrane protein YccC